MKFNYYYLILFSFVLSSCSGLTKWSECNYGISTALGAPISAAGVGVACLGVLSSNEDSVQKKPVEQKTNSKLQQRSISHEVYYLSKQ